jgi:hypothetical protein
LKSDSETKKKKDQFCVFGAILVAKAGDIALKNNVTLTTAGRIGDRLTDRQTDRQTQTSPNGLVSTFIVHHRPFFFSPLLF